MMKKKTHHIIFFGVLMTLFILYSIQFVEIEKNGDNTSNSSNSSLNSKQEPIVNVIKFNHGSLDFQNENQGTLIVKVKAPIQKINPEGSISKVLIFSSEYFEKLSILYDLKDKTFTAGAPFMFSSPVNLFDGSLHMIGYTFDKNVGQALYFDGNLIAFGKFFGTRAEKSKITAMVIHGPSYPDIDVGSEASVLDKALSADEINRMN